MYGGGMYGGGMYGRYGMGGMGGMGGMMGANGQGGAIEKFTQFVYSFCDVAQIVEFNANGLSAFFMLLKRFFTWMFKFSTTTLVAVGLYAFGRC